MTTINRFTESCYVIELNLKKKSMNANFSTTTNVHFIYILQTGSGHANSQA